MIWLTYDWLIWLAGSFTGMTLHWLSGLFSRLAFLLAHMFMAGWLAWLARLIGWLLAHGLLVHGRLIAGMAGFTGLLAHGWLDHR